MGRSIVHYADNKTNILPHHESALSETGGTKDGGLFRTPRVIFTNADYKRYSSNEDRNRN